MKYKWLNIFCGFLLVCSLPAASPSWSGQVVTKDVRLWAREALQEEKALDTIKGRNTLAVLYFHNKTGRAELDPLRKGLALMLITDLSTLEGLQVIERVRFQALAEEMGLGVSGLVDPGTAPRIGKILGSEWLVGGDISEGEPLFIQIESDLIDVPASGIIGQQTTEGRLEELFRMEKDILFEIIELLKIELTPQQEAALKRPCSSDSRALVSFFKGIEESDRGNYEKAAGLYENALRSDPGICKAGTALKELQALGLVSINKRGSELLRSLREQTSFTDQVTADDINKRTGDPADTPASINFDITFQ